MSARLVSSQLIKNIQKGTKSIAVEYVDKTTSWTRPSNFPSTSVKEDFTQVAQENIDSLTSETTRVAMKYALYQLQLSPNNDVENLSTKVTRTIGCIILPMSWIRMEMYWQPAILSSRDKHVADSLSSNWSLELLPMNFMPLFQFHYFAGAGLYNQ